MGEIAEMMLDGELCACCGVHLKGEAEGFARYCSSCSPDFEEKPAKKKRRKRTKKNRRAS